MSIEPHPTQTAKGVTPVLLILAGAALVIGGLYLWATFSIRVPRLVDPVGPRAFPILIVCGLGFAGVLMGMEHFQTRRGQPREAVGAGSSWIVAGIFVWTLGYIALFERLGYVLATALYILPMMFYFNRGRPVANIVTGVLFCALSYYVLAVLLGAQLPRGEWLRGFMP